MIEIQRRSTALPIYQQISEVLIREIAAGRLVEGERLPPERALAKEYGTTVRTLRKALADLQDRGLLERRQGSGNYIKSAGAGVNSIYSMFRLELHQGGGLPTARVISVDECQKPDDLPQFGTSPKATRVRRLRFLNDIPIALEEIWLDRNFGTLPKGSDLPDSLYYYYKAKLKFWIARAEDRVSIAPFPQWAPAPFDKKIGQMAGYVQRLSWAQSPEAAEFSKTWFDPETTNYVQRLI